LNELLQAAATAITSAAVTTTAPTAAIRETTNIVPLPLPPSVPSATTTSAATVSNDNSNDIRDVLVAIELFLDELNGFPVAVRYLCPLFSKHTKANRCGLALQTRFNSNQVMADMEKSRPVWVLATAGYDEEEVNVYLKIECRRTGIRAFCSLLDIQRDIYSFSDRVDNGGKWTRLAEAQMQLYALRRARKWH
jgi:hypothetical protein